MFLNNRLLNGKKAQGMVIDLIMLILIVSLFFIFLSSQMPNQAPDAGVIRSKSMQVQRIFIALMNAETDNTSSFQNTSVIELISEGYCGKSTFNDLNLTIQKTMQFINKPNNYFILSSCIENDCSKPKSYAICSPEIEAKFDSCCIKTDKVTVAILRLNLPDSCSHKFTQIELGIWPRDVEVEKC